MEKCILLYLHQCKLLIKEQALNQPQYCLPSTSQVAAIIVGGEEAGGLSGKEIWFKRLVVI